MIFKPYELSQLEVQYNLTQLVYKQQEWRLFVVVHFTYHIRPLVNHYQFILSLNINGGKTQRPKSSSGFPPVQPLDEFKKEGFLNFILFTHYNVTYFNDYVQSVVMPLFHFKRKYVEIVIFVCLFLIYISDANLDTLLAQSHSARLAKYQAWLQMCRNDSTFVHYSDFYAISDEEREYLAKVYK